MSSSLLLAGIATVLVGTADFWGAIGSRHGRPIAVAGWSQIVGVLGVSLALLVFGGSFIAGDVWWGAVGGVTIGFGLMALYVGFASSAVGIISPVSAVITVAVPVVFGLVRGERPSAVAMAGIAAGVGAVALVGTTGDRSGPRPMRGVMLGLGAGLGFGLGLALLGNTSEASGLWPLLASRFAAGGSILIGALAVRRPLLPNRRSWGVIAMAALFGAAGMSCFTVAAQQGPLTLVAVVTAMFPAVTVGLATIVLGERMRRPQVLGVALAVVAVAMISIG